MNYLWVDKRYQEFSLDDYTEMVDHLPKNMLPAIAPHIKTLGRRERNTRIKKICSNVESLRINYKITLSDARKINSWIKESNIKSLCFKICDNIDALLYGVSHFQELDIAYSHQNVDKIIEKNTNLQRLSIDLDEYDFNFHVFGKLQALRSLHIRSTDVEDLTELQEFVKFENLTEFSFKCDTFDNQHSFIIHSFMEHLTKKSKIEKLQLVNCAVDAHIFDALESLNLSTLSLCWDVSSKDLTNFIQKNSSRHLKHLKLSTCSSEQLIMLEKWKSLESLCIYVNDKHSSFWDGAFIKEILKTSMNRPPLTLHVMATRDEILPIHIEISINFVKQEFKVMERNDEFCCSNSKCFDFSSRECFTY